MSEDVKADFTVEGDRIAFKPSAFRELRRKRGIKPSDYPKSFTWDGTCPHCKQPIIIVFSKKNIADIHRAFKYKMDKAIKYIRKRVGNLVIRPGKKKEEAEKSV